MKFQLTAVFIEDEKSRGYTAFFAELPNIVSEGNTLEQARELLEECFQLAIKDIGKRGLEKVKEKHVVQTLDVEVVTEKTKEEIEYTKKRGWEMANKFSALVQSYLGMSPSDKQCKNWSEMRDKMVEETADILEEYFDLKLEQS